MRNVTLLMVVASIVGACASVTPTPPTVVALSASATPSITTITPPHPTAPEPSVAPEPTRTAAVAREPVGLEVSQSPAFVGDRLTLTTTSISTGLRLSSATIDFGDGSSAVATSSCTDRISVGHAYRKDGDYAPTVSEVSACDRTTVVDLSGASATVHVFPAAPVASVRWHVCTTFQLPLAGPWSGAGLGKETSHTSRSASARAWGKEVGESRDSDGVARPLGLQRRTVPVSIVQSSSSGLAGRALQASRR